MLNRLALVARSVTFGALLLGTTLVPAIPAGAADLSQTPTGRAALFNIEAPTTGTMIHNGSIYAVSGWTAGTRVDVYLDGPAGVGTGIDSADVVGSRADVARAFGAALARSGFEVTWRPTELPGGPHRFFVYSLIDGTWTLQMVPIVGEGNVLPPEKPPNPDRQDRN